MEKVRVLLDDGQHKDFDRLVHTGLPECGDLTIATKDGAMESGAPGVVIAFTVQLPSGDLAPVQAVTSLKALRAALRILDARYVKE